MFHILKDIFSSDIAMHLAFKGGTACYFFYGLDRFSTDLDLDLIEDAPIDQALETILKRYGTLKKGQKLILSYGEEDINIKIDVSRRIWKANKYGILNFYGTDIRVQDRGSIFANKLVTLIERGANRDIYDVWFFFIHMFPLSADIILERTGKTTKELLFVIREQLQKLPRNYTILDGLGEVLSEKQKYFVKERLITELIGVIDFHIDF